MSGIFSVYKYEKKLGVSFKKLNNLKYNHHKNVLKNVIFSLNYSY